MNGGETLKQELYNELEHLRHGLAGIPALRLGRALQKGLGIVVNMPHRLEWSRVKHD